MARFSLRGFLGLDDSNFQSGMKRSKASTQDFTAMASRLKGVLAGAFSVGAITRYTRMIVENAQRVKDLAQIYRQTTARVQEVDIAARQSGLTFENIASAMDQVEVKRQHAIRGNERMIQTFERLGFSMEELRRPESMLEMFIERFGGASASASEMAAMFELLPERAGKVLTSLENIGKVDISIVSDAELDKIDVWAKKVQNATIAAKQWATSTAGKGLFGLEMVGIGIRNAHDPKRANEMADKLMGELFGGLDLGKAVSDGIAKSPIFSESKGKFKAVAGAMMDHPPAPERVEPTKLGAMPAADSLRRIGGFVGAATQSTVSIEKEQLRELKEIKRNTDRASGQTAIF